MDGWSRGLGGSCGDCGRLRSMVFGSRGELRGVGPEEPGGVRRFRAFIVASAEVPSWMGSGRGKASQLVRRKTK